jgi:hypothetical protein
MTGAVQPASHVAAAADLVLGRGLDLTTLDQARLGRGAAHIEGDDVLQTALTPHERRGDHARCRSRLHRHRRHS